MIKIKIPPKKNNKFLKNFFIKKKLKFVIDLSRKRIDRVNQLRENEKYFPDLNDLYRLYQFLLLNKRTTVFEFGSGWSTLMFSLALKELGLGLGLRLE